MREPVRVALFGVGEIGRHIARFLVGKPGIEVVAAVDSDPAKAGRDLGEVLGTGRRLGVVVATDAERGLHGRGAEVAVHATGSYFRPVFAQLQALVEHDINVVSTCEELGYPYLTEPGLAEELDGLAQRHGVSVLGTGINPGFLMDTLPIVLSSACSEIKVIRMKRAIDASGRRQAFQKKVGAGLTPEGFAQAVEERTVTGHVGLEQSIGLFAAAVGWEIDSIQAGLPQPVLATAPVCSPKIRVEAGQVAGMRQVARGTRRGEDVIVLEFEAYLGAPDERDEVHIDGTPPIHMTISPCVHGEPGTVGVVASAIPRVLAAPPGLITVKELPLPSAWLGGPK
ncbi:MAG: dihydrodipicolinate reductase [Dehalococcoidia bacterium]|nr:dihydrodipicolinate reductase [Dehalococcoidia bacterium]